MDKLVNKTVLANWIVASSSFVLLMALLLIYSKGMPPQIPLWYTKPWGDQQLGTPLWLWLLTGGGLGLGIVNGVGSSLIKNKNLKMMFLISGITTQLVLTFGILRIVLLVI